MSIVYKVLRRNTIWKTVSVDAKFQKALRKEIEGDDWIQCDQDRDTTDFWQYGKDHFLF
jgi:hypothetical protein